MLRTPKAEPVSSSSGIRVFLAKIETKKSGHRTLYVGHLIVTGVDGTETTRDVEGEACDEVASALAVFSALAIDPDAKTSKITVPAASSSASTRVSSSSSVAVPSPKPSSSAAPASVSDPSTVSSAAPSTTMVDAVPRPETKASTVLDSPHSEVMLGFDVRGGISPAPGWGLVGTFGYLGTGWWAPSLRLSLEGGTYEEPVTSVQGAPATTRSGNVTFNWLGVRALGCVLRRDIGPVSIEPCAGFELDVHSIVRVNIPEAGQDNLGWFAPMLATHARFPARTRFALDVTGSVFTPLFRRTVTIDSGTQQVYSTPVVAGSVVFGLSWRIQ